MITLEEMIPSAGYRFLHPEYAALPDPTVWALEQKEKEMAQTIDDSQEVPYTYTRNLSGKADTIDDITTEFYKTMKESNPNFTVRNIETAQRGELVILTVGYTI